MREYTKGKWKVGEPFDKYGTEFPIYGEDNYELARVFIHNGEQKTNAQLISASPDLYEALIKMATDIQGDEATCVLRETQLLIYRALDKAEGK